MQTIEKNQSKLFQIDVANDINENDAHNNDVFINVPQHLQPSLDAVLDYYVETGQKPIIKLCGNPLDVVSGFIRKMEETLPPHLLNNGKDIMDFIIHNLCEFGREKSVNQMIFNFTFMRNGGAV